MTDVTHARIDTPPEGWEVVEAQTLKGYTLRAYRLPYYEQTLEFIQVEHPDSFSTSYFRGDGQGGIEAGPFGGGMSWSVPKYVVKAATRFFNETFPPTTESESNEPDNHPST